LIEMAIHVGFRREAGSYEAVTLANSNACATYEGKIVKDIALCRRKQIPAALRQRLWSFRINSQPELNDAEKCCTLSQVSGTCGNDPIRLHRTTKISHACRPSTTPVGLLMQLEQTTG